MEEVRKEEEDIGIDLRILRRNLVSFQETVKKQSALIRYLEKSDKLNWERLRRRRMSCLTSITS